MVYTRKEHSRNVLTGLVSGLIAGIFIAVVSETQNWWIAIFLTSIYAIIGYWVSWWLVKAR